MMAFAALALAACSNDDPANPGGGQPANEVWMQGSNFSPAARTTTTGSSITFVNKEATIHNIVSATIPAGAAAFASGTMPLNDTFAVNLTITGTYNYFCTIHGTATTGMRGTITVN